MEIAPFETEHFFARYEFTTPHLLCTSDCETTSIGELLEMARVPLEELTSLRLGYTESEGDPELRRAIADSYETVEATDVLVLGSPIEGIYLAARSLLSPGDEVIVLTPAYDALVNVFEHVAGARSVKHWALEPTAAGWDLDLDRLRALISPDTRLLVVNFPHNPTGFVPSETVQRQILELARDNGTRVFYDEMYYGLFHSETQPVPSAADIDSNAVVLSGLSKSHGLPGLRTGWLVVRDADMRRQLLNWKFYTSICPPAPSEFLARAALKVADQLIARNLAIIEKNLALADAFFQRHRQRFSWRRPMGGSVGLVGVNAGSVTEWAARLAEEVGVLVHPATMLGAGDGCMRLGFGKAGFETALAVLDRHLDAAGGDS